MDKDRWSRLKKILFSADMIFILLLYVVLFFTTQWPSR